MLISMQYGYGIIILFVLALVRLLPHILTFSLLAGILVKSKSCVARRAQHEQKNLLSGDSRRR
jgi:hypothetical protein